MIRHVLPLVLVVSSCAAQRLSVPPEFRETLCKQDLRFVRATYPDDLGAAANDVLARAHLHESNCWASSSMVVAGMDAGGPDILVGFLERVIAAGRLMGVDGTKMAIYALAGSLDHWAIQSRNVSPKAFAYLVVLALDRSYWEKAAVGWDGDQRERKDRIDFLASAAFRALKGISQVDYGDALREWAENDEAAVAAAVRNLLAGRQVADHAVPLSAASLRPYLPEASALR